MHYFDKLISCCNISACYLEPYFSKRRKDEGILGASKPSSLSCRFFVVFRPQSGGVGIVVEEKSCGREPPGNWTRCRDNRLLRTARFCPSRAILIFSILLLSLYNTCFLYIVYAYPFMVLSAHVIINTYHYSLIPQSIYIFYSYIISIWQE